MVECTLVNGTSRLIFYAYIKILMYDPSQKVLAQCYKTFNIRNLLMFFIGTVFVPVKTLHPSLMFARKHRVYPSEVIFRVHLSVVCWPYSQHYTRLESPDWDKRSSLLRTLVNY